MSVEKRGPYVSDDFREFWLRVEDYTLPDARREAASWARDFMDYEFGRSRFVGRVLVPLHDHEDWEDCHECVSVPAWHFELYEGTYRA